MFRGWSKKFHVHCTTQYKKKTYDKKNIKHLSNLNQSEVFVKYSFDEEPQRMRDEGWRTVDEEQGIIDYSRL